MTEPDEIVSARADRRWTGKAKGAVSRHPVMFGFGLLAVVCMVVGGTVWRTATSLEPSVVYFGVPDAPVLDAEPGETVYRLDASRSKVTYTVDEKLAGVTHTANGTTQGVAGDIALNLDTPGNSRVGDIAINVQQLTSDQQLRDERLRHDYLRSNDYPVATFVTTSLDGLPDRIAPDTDYKFTINGDLTVKETTKPVALKTTGKLVGNELRLDATTTVSLTSFGIGPINMVGFVQAGDKAQLDFDLVAVDVADFTDTDRVASTAATGNKPSGKSPSFKNDIQPILADNCASCHQTGEPGAPFWELTDAADAARVADGLALITESRYMPPFLATDVGVPVKHDPRLTGKQITTIGDWAAAGAKLDVAEDAPVKPSREQTNRIDPTMTLKADAPYEGSTDKTNDYRCLIMDPELTKDTALTGYEFMPDKNEFVHHALIFKMAADQREVVDDRDAADPGTGYECFGGVGAESVIPSPTGMGGGTDLVSAWAPGQSGEQFPDGSGMQMGAGDFFVIQVHYHFVHAAPPDHSELAVEFGDKPADDYDNIEVTQYLAPAEIPCMPDEEGPLCDRDAMLDDLESRYGPSGPVIATTLNAMCGSTPEMTANVDENGISRSSCDQWAVGEGEIVSVFGHMHELGRTFRMTLNPDTKDEKVLLDIDRWDFDWQLNYTPAKKTVVGPGDIVRVECSWDRNLINPQAEPRWVSWAEGTEDEMCYSALTTRVDPDAQSYDEFDPELIEPGVLDSDETDVQVGG